MTYNPAEVIRELRERDLYDLAATIAKAHQCTVHELVSTRRTQAFCDARHELWAKLYSTGNWSLPRIGELCRRDHSTVMVGIRKHNAAVFAAAQVAA